MIKIKEIINNVIKLLDEKKAEHIITLDLQKLTSITDYFIIITANSETHLKTLAKEIIKNLKNTYKWIPINPLNDNETNWILLDYQDFIIHIFQQETREYYNLEELWFEAKKYEPGKK